MSELHASVDDWLRSAGARITDDAQPPAVREHLRDCAECRASLDEVAETRSWFPVQASPVSEQAMDAIRFRIAAEARTARAPASTPAVAPRRPRAAWLAVAAATLALAGIAFAAVRYAAPRDTRRESTPEATLARGAAIPSKSLPQTLRSAERPAADQARPPRTTPTPGPAAAPIERATTLDRARRPDVTPPPRARQIDPREPNAGVVHDRSGAHAGFDEAFARAWQLLEDGRPDAAAFAFDALLAEDLGAREADVLYWSARAHLAAHREVRAQERLDELLTRHPGSWHAADARALRDRLR